MVCKKLRNYQREVTVKDISQENGTKNWFLNFSGLGRKTETFPIKKNIQAQRSFATIYTSSQEACGKM